MIELKNISKTYKSKKGTKTQALNDVSIKFGEKGMTFILGKSGSGKSTLLNILGGLDKYDIGDMIIYGKSSASFTNAELDSYRNTYVGFIFQEFNLLEDYNVYENIVLALQLQEKEINEKEIDELLERLELKNLKLRKVNELSGGQKQRVAIARALIKNPSIILADEPTGNLDSKTGTQVMELLKSISKEKQVIIVTHDEEYASIYGDRIIEIKDGKVIKDTNEEKCENKNNNYQIVKSRLPFKDSFKLGIGSLKHKKIKLVCTIILMIITLGFLSCVDTLSSHNFSSSHAKYLTEKGKKYIEVEKKEFLKTEYGTENLLLELDEKDLTNIKEKLNKNYYEVYEYNDIEDGYFDYNKYSLEGMLHIKEDIQNGYYSTNTSELVKLVVTDNIKESLGVDIIGEIPKESNEIVISNYVANLIISNGIEIVENDFKTEFEEKSYYYPKSIEEIINSNYTYYLGIEKVKIVGILNYDLSDLNDFYKNNVLSKLVVNKKFIDERKDKISKSIREDINIRVKLNENEIDTSYIVDILDEEIEYYDGSSWKKTDAIKDDEIILSLNELTSGDISFYENLNNYTNKHREDYNASKKRFVENYIKQKNIIGKNIIAQLEYNYSAVIKEFNVKVIGITLGDEYGTYMSLNNLSSYRQKEVSLTSVLYPIENKKSIKEATELFPYEDVYAIKSTYSDRLYEEYKIFKNLAKLAFYVGLAFLAFTVFLIANFMVTSISYRKKEIGILRALGSSGLDVMKIFIWEAIVLSIISGIIASILLVIVSNFMNGFIMKNLRLLTTPFIVGIRQFIVIFALVFIVTIISSMLPLHRISKMKPIDAILKK